MIAIQIYDKRDETLPDIGLVNVCDLETGESRWINTSSSSVRKAYNRRWYDSQQQMNSIMSRCGVDIASISTNEDYVKALKALLQRRGVR